MRAAGMLLGALILAASLTEAQQVDPASPQATRRENELAAFDAADRAAPVRGGIVFVGSSSIVDWDVARHFPEWTITNRGLWGSTLADAVQLAGRLVLPYEPRLVVLYAGDNDINAGRLAEQVAVDFDRFVRAVHAKLPQTRIVYIGIKPSIDRWSQIDRMRAANRMIRAICERDDRVAFVDVDGAMLGWDERPRRELFVEDGLHLSLVGYQLWSTLLRPFLAP